MTPGILWAAGLMVATTVGAGLFALPYVARGSGWLIALGFLVVLASATRFVQELYARSLAATPGHRRLVGLATKHLGESGRLVALLFVSGGLLFSLVVYLVLGAKFIALLSPVLGGWGVSLMWLAGSLPLLFRLRRMFVSEFAGAVVMAALVLAVFIFGFRSTGAPVPAAAWSNFFLPFALILGALSGWPAVGEIVEYAKANRLGLPGALRAMRLGTLASALMYALFTAGILLGTVSTSPDTLSGLDWPAWAVGTLAVLGLFAIWTSYVPSAWEVKDSLTHDLAWSETSAFLAVLTLPPFLLWLGLDDLLSLLGLMGGLFLSLTYALMLRIAQKALRLSLREIYAAYVLMLLFGAAAVYEAWYFVVQ
jgi:amino acid permease